jgi:hypothetical protein
MTYDGVKGFNIVGPLANVDAEQVGRKADRAAAIVKMKREFDRDGYVRRTYDGMLHVVNRSAKHPGRFQMTWFTRDGEPGGDSERATLKEILGVLWDNVRWGQKKKPDRRPKSQSKKTAKVRFGRMIVT